MISLLLSFAMASEPVMVIVANGDRWVDGVPDDEQALRWHYYDAWRVAHVARLGFVQDHILVFATPNPLDAHTLFAEEPPPARLDDILAGVSALRERLGTTLDLTLYVASHGDPQNIHLDGGPVPHDELRSKLKAAAGGQLEAWYADSCNSAGWRSGMGRSARGEVEWVAGGDFSVPWGSNVSVAAKQSVYELDELRAGNVSLALVTAWLGAADGNADDHVDAYELQQFLLQRRRTYGDWYDVQVNAPKAWDRAELGRVSSASRLAVGGPLPARWLVATAGERAGDGLVLIGDLTTGSDQVVDLRLVPDVSYVIARVALDASGRTPPREGEALVLRCFDHLALANRSDHLLGDGRLCEEDDPVHGGLDSGSSPAARMLDAVAGTDVAPSLVLPPPGRRFGYWGRRTWFGPSVRVSNGFDPERGAAGWPGVGLGLWRSLGRGPAAMGGELDVRWEAGAGGAPSRGMMFGGMLGGDLGLAATPRLRLGLRLGPAAEVIWLRRAEVSDGPTSQVGWMLGIDAGPTLRWALGSQMTLLAGGSWAPRVLLSDGEDVVRADLRGARGSVMVGIEGTLGRLRAPAGGAD